MAFFLASSALAAAPPAAFSVTVIDVYYSAKSTSERNCPTQIVRCVSDSRCGHNRWCGKCPTQTNSRRTVEPITSWMSSFDVDRKHFLDCFSLLIHHKLASFG